MQIAIINLIIFAVICLMMVSDNIKEKDEQAEVAASIELLEDKAKTLYEDMEKIPVMPKRREPTNIEYDRYMHIITNTISSEIYFYIAFTQNFKEVKFIDFEHALKTISDRVAKGISSDMFYDLQYYHAESWIVEYIVKYTEVTLYDYVKEHGIRLREKVS